MKDLQNLKFTGVTPPAAIIDNASATTATVDIKGLKEVMFLVYLGALDIAVTALKVMESDDSGMSGAVLVAGTDYSVAPLTLPTATDDNHFFAVFVEPRGRKRYLKPTLTLGDGSTGTFVTALSIGIPVERPDTAADRGLTQQAIV